MDLNKIWVLHESSARCVMFSTQNTFYKFESQLVAIFLSETTWTVRAFRLSTMWNNRNSWLHQRRWISETRTKGRGRAGSYVGAEVRPFVCSLARVACVRICLIACLFAIFLLVCVFVCVFAWMSACVCHVFLCPCSTSPPGVAQIDGSPPALNPRSSSLVIDHQSWSTRVHQGSLTIVVHHQYSMLFAASNSYCRRLLFCRFSV